MIHNGAYGITANIFEEDHQFKLAERVWLTGGTAGEGRHRFIVLGMSKEGKPLQKWIPILRLSNFKACYIPDTLLGKITDHPHKLRNSKDEAEILAAEIQAYSDKLRAAAVQPFKGRMQ